MSKLNFKQWLKENLAGPGGGPDLEPFDLVRYYRDITSKGAGAFTTIGEYPPVNKSRIKFMSKKENRKNRKKGKLK